MPVVCLYFQIHQPFRLRKYTVFDSDPSYFDNDMNAQLVQRIAQRCYIPMNRLLLDLIRDHAGRFRFAMSVTGTAIEQFEAYAPEVMQGLHALAETGAVEFLGETYDHSLASLHSVPEFVQQVQLHREMIRRLFGQQPTVFRNTELIYSDAIASLVAEQGFKAMLAEGWDPVLNNRSAAFLYHAARSNLTLILRNYRLSDAIAFRFADPRSPDFPLTDEKFSHLVGQIGGQLCNLFMDYETFGEHQPQNTGIFDFIRTLPGRLMRDHSEFQLPREVIANGGGGEIAGELSVPHPISWADESRDLGAWMGNAMQTNALAELYKLEIPVKRRADAKLLANWRKLTTSDHLYYMSTKTAADAAVHTYFRPYESPYDAYINFMNVLDNLRARAG